MKNFFYDCMLFKSKLPLHKFLGVTSWISVIGIIAAFVRIYIEKQ